MIDIHKRVIRYQIEHGLRYCKHICKQRNFLANGADLIGRQET